MMVAATTRVRVPWRHGPKDCDDHYRYIIDGDDNLVALIPRRAEGVVTVVIDAVNQAGESARLISRVQGLLAAANAEVERRREAEGRAERYAAEARKWREAWHAERRKARRADG